MSGTIDLDALAGLLAERAVGGRRVIAALAYFADPKDMIPDHVPVLAKPSSLPVGATNRHSGGGPPGSG